MMLHLKVLFKGPFTLGQSHVLEKVIDRDYPGVPRQDEFITVGPDVSLRIDAVAWDGSSTPELHFLQESARDSYADFLRMGFKPEGG